jgi:hypothetical protein
LQESCREDYLEQNTGCSLVACQYYVILQAFLALATGVAFPFFMVYDGSRMIRDRKRRWLFSVHRLRSDFNSTWSRRRDTAFLRAPFVH